MTSDLLQWGLIAVFVSVTTFPGRALAFENEVELSQRSLIFVRDPTLADVAVVGIEAWPRQCTVAMLLRSPSLEVRSTLATGSAVRVLSTAYSSTVEQTDASPYIAASGRRVGPGMVAANFLPLGTKIRIGQRIYTVWDRMNSRYDGKYVVDIWQPSRVDALRYGARVVEMEIVSMP